FLDVGRGKLEEIAGGAGTILETKQVGGISRLPRNVQLDGIGLAGSDWNARCSAARGPRGEEDGAQEVGGGGLGSEMLPLGNGDETLIGEKKEENREGRNGNRRTQPPEP